MSAGEFVGADFHACDVQWLSIIASYSSHDGAARFSIIDRASAKRTLRT